MSRRATWEVRRASADLRAAQSDQERRNQPAEEPQKPQVHEHRHLKQQRLDCRPIGVLRASGSRTQFVLHAQLRRDVGATGLQSLLVKRKPERCRDEVRGGEVGLEQNPRESDRWRAQASASAAGLAGDCRAASRDGQLILPLLDLVEQAQCAIDDLVDVMGRATIEAVLAMSAAQLAGPKQQGQKADRDVVYHGTQKGRVALKERQLGVTEPAAEKAAASAG